MNTGKDIDALCMVIGDFEPEHSCLRMVSVRATETEIVERARSVILDALNAPVKEWLDGDTQRVSLAKWVIENIWTPDADARAA